MMPDLASAYGERNSLHRPSKPVYGPLTAHKWADNDGCPIGPIMAKLARGSRDFFSFPARPSGIHAKPGTEPLDRLRPQ
jgi:hypothetical protein